MLGCGRRRNRPLSLPNSSRGTPSSRRAASTQAPPPISRSQPCLPTACNPSCCNPSCRPVVTVRSEEHTSELQSQFHLVCRLLLEKKKKDVSTTCVYKYKNKR